MRHPCNSFQLFPAGHNGRLAIIILALCLSWLPVRGQQQPMPRPEVTAEFPGGFDKYCQFLKDNIRYPKACEEKGQQGHVAVEFTVAADGSLSNFKVIRSPNKLLSEEALRVAKLMPRWTPARNGGKAVASRFTAFVTFRLPSGEAAAVAPSSAPQKKDSQDGAQIFVKKTIPKVPGRNKTDLVIICFSQGIWVEDSEKGSYLQDRDNAMAFPDSSGSVFKLDGKLLEREKLTEVRCAPVRKLEISHTSGRTIVNVVTKNVTPPDSVMTNMPKEQTIFVFGRGHLGISDVKARPGDWTHYSTTSWKKNPWSYSIHDDLGGPRPGRKIYVYASTEATRQEVERAEAELRKIGFTNYEIVRDIPIRHWTDAQYREWAGKQKRLHPKYDTKYLFDAIAHEGVDGNDLRDKWHIVKEVYGVK